ncbi:MAG: hypothetical protein JJU00_04455 [Opitutales bacterium]|nr:hypothetical protein [Opitutales bacterium]
MKRASSSSGPRRVLHLVSQAHLDPVWLWPLRDGVAETLTTMQSAVDRAAEHRDFKFTRSSAATYKWIKEMDPRLFRRVCKLAEDGRWEVIGGWIEQPDCMLPSTESFIRQGLYGKAFFRDNLGPAGRTEIGYNVDSFGHAGGLPQILRATGFRYYIFMRPQDHDGPPLPLLFHWEGPDGSRVLAQRIPIQYSQSYAATPDEIEATIRSAADRCFAPGFRNGVTWFGVGNHGGGPTRAHIERVKELQKDPGLPEIRFSTAREYFAAVESEEAIRDVPVVKDEFPFLFRGCYSSTGEVKQLNRTGEKALHTAEVLHAINGSAEPEELRDAWWQLLFNQFHDILAGTCVASVADENRHRYGDVLNTAGDAARRAVFSMARRVDTRGERGSVLFVANPLPWPRTAVVRLDTFRSPHGEEEITHLETRDGRRVPLQWTRADANFGPWGLPWGKLTAAVDLPAGGYRVFRLATAPLTKRITNPFGDGTATEQFVDTGNPRKKDAPRRRTRKAPALAALFAGKENLLSGPVRPVVINDAGGAWGHGIPAFRDEAGYPASQGSEVLEDGPVLTLVREKFRWESSEIWMDAVHYNHGHAVELQIRFNWQQKRRMLKLEIPARLADTRAFAKMPGAVAMRKADGNEAPCHDWIVLQGKNGGRTTCVGIINDSTYAYDALDGTVRLTLARAVPNAEHPPFEYKDDRDIDFLDQGWQRRRFLLTARRGRWTSLRPDRLAEAFQIPAEHMLDSAHPGSALWEQSHLSLDPPNVALLALKAPETGRGRILRVQETTGRRTTAHAEWNGHAFEFFLAPWEIKTLRLRQGKSELTVTETDALEGAEA